MAYDAPYSPQIAGGHGPIHLGLRTKVRLASIIGLFAKRVCDFAIAAAALAVVSPLFAIFYVLIRLDGGPCLFGHTRIGAGGKPFPCLKFRTMIVDGDRTLRAYLAANPDAAAEWAMTCKLKHDPRVTRIGRILRSTSLDELPQLLNVLWGEMSLVGPRPITAAEAGRYGTAISCYHAVRPGITGLWQISGRSTTSYDRRVELDCRYVAQRTFWMDMAILAKTIPAVLSRDGAH